MIDLHCHILPGLDDGPSAMDESVEMCRIAAADGIRTIVSSPHFRPGKYDYTAVRMQELLDELRGRLQSEHIEVAVLPAAEVAITPDLPSLLQKETHLTINGGKYFLVEFPNDMIPPRWTQFLSPLNLKGRVPVLVHPERSRWLAAHADDLALFVEYGGLVQITAGSLLGESGSDVRDAAVMLLKRNLAQVIASDAHSADMRPPRLAAAVRRAAEIVGQERAKAMATDAPAAILAGERVVMPPPAPAERRGWFARMMTF